VRLKENPQIHGRIISATIKRKADRWFVSFCVEQEIPNPPRNTGPRIGVDLGVKSLATFSDGRKIENPQALLRKLRKLRRYSRKVSKKKKGSRNQTKAIIRLARLHWRISNIRRDKLHKVTTHLAKNHSQIFIEDLGIKGMMKESRLSWAIADVGWGEFRRQLTYKAKWYGSKVILAPRFFPSSKRCSRCGQTKKKFALSEHIFKCQSCGLHLDRDLNAANNLVAAS
jgi:putative transposase